jgi:hypothetical protein
MREAEARDHIRCDTYEGNFRRKETRSHIQSGWCFMVELLFHTPKESYPREYQTHLRALSDEMDLSGRWGTADIGIEIHPSQEGC